MNFFKSAKYKVNESSSKTKNEETYQDIERFQKLEDSNALNNESTKDKAPPSDVKNVSNNDIISCLRISNKTPFPLKLKEKANVFPNEVPANDSTLVTLGKDQATVQVVYVLEIRSKDEEIKTYEFKIEIVSNVDAYELIVDWMNLSELNGIQLTPVSASFAEPIKLGKNEELLEIEYNQ